MLKWALQGQIARGSRARHGTKWGCQVPKSAVDSWIKNAKRLRIKSIICLLDEQHLGFYQKLPVDLISYYRRKGFKVVHVPAKNNQRPPLTRDHLEGIWNAFRRLQKPVLIHCSAGVSRTGSAVAFVKHKMRLRIMKS